MIEPKFLTVQQIEEFHNQSLMAFGGLQGLRDRGLFESAVFQPQNDYYYGSANLFGIAAAYAFHIAQISLLSMVTSEQPLWLH